MRLKLTRQGRGDQTGNQTGGEEGTKGHHGGRAAGLIVLLQRRLASGALNKSRDAVLGSIVGREVQDAHRSNAGERWQSSYITGGGLIISGSESWKVVGRRGEEGKDEGGHSLTSYITTRAFSTPKVAHANEDIAKVVTKPSQPKS